MGDTRFPEGGSPSEVFVLVRIRVLRRRRFTSPARTRPFRAEPSTVSAHSMRAMLALQPGQVFRPSRAYGYVVRLIFRVVRRSESCAFLRLTEWLDARTHLRLRWCAMRCSTLRGGYHTGRVLHGGRTMVDSAALCFAAPLLDLQPHDSRRVRWDPRGPYNQGARRLKNKRSLDPLDLDAGSPVTSRSIRFGQPAELPLLGFPKTAPPSY